MLANLRQARVPLMLSIPTGIEIPCLAFWRCPSLSHARQPRNLQLERLVCPKRDQVSPNSVAADFHALRSGPAEDWASREG